MVTSEVGRGEAAARHQSGHEGVPHRGRCHHGRRWREPKRVGLALHPYVQMECSHGRESRGRIPGDRDDIYVAPAEDRRELHDLVRRPGVGDQDHDITVHDGTGVTVKRLGRVDENRGSSGTREARGHTPSCVSGLTYTGDNHAAVRAEDQLDNVGDVRIEPTPQRFDRGGFDLKRSLGGSKHIGTSVPWRRDQTLPVKKTISTSVGLLP